MMNGLKVLVACENSGTVRDRFRELGHDAWSCDLLPCDGDARYHWKGDVLALLNYNEAQRKLIQRSRGLPVAFDLMIGHPTCTYLCNSGVCWLYQTWTAADAPRPEDIGGRHANVTRWKQMEAAAKFFLQLKAAKIPYIALENPIPHGYAARLIGKYDQLIQPWMFGHMEQKATCLWLKGLPPLEETNNVKTAMMGLPRKERMRTHYLSPSKDRWKIRSKTFDGIAAAMAKQWGDYVLEQKGNQCSS